MTRGRVRVLAVLLVATGHGVAGAQTMPASPTPGTPTAPGSGSPAPVPPGTPAAAPSPAPAPAHPSAPARPAKRISTSGIGSLPASIAHDARTQTLLARAGYSPGLIDGRPGRKTKIALEHVQQARGLDVTGVLDESTAASLAASDALGAGEGWTRTYRITEADMALVTGPIPEDWNERAALERSGYADLKELLAETGWCTPDMVQSLNPGVTIDELAAGDEVTLPDVTAPAIPRLARVEVNLTEKLVLGFNADGVNVFLTHCSIARLVEKRPVGELHVKVVAVNPEYTFDPKDWPEVENVTSKLRIAPGPRNPVGAAWVGLDKPGYGMHGTVRPQDIGKTGSHGCFRLANWDATRLAKAVKVGMPVEIKE